MVVRVRDEEVARGVDGDPRRGPQLGVRGGAEVAAEAGNADAGHGGDDPGAGRHLADAVVLWVCDEEVS